MAIVLSFNGCIAIENIAGIDLNGDGVIGENPDDGNGNDGGLYDIYEPDNTAYEATSLDFTASQHHGLTAGDEDWIALSVIGGFQYTVETYATSIGTITDTYIYLYQSNGSTLVAEDDDGGDNTYSMVSFTADYTGFYYLRVKGYSDSTTGYYSVQIITDGLVTTTLNVGDSLFGSISVAADTDWYESYLWSGVTYVIETSSAGTGDDVDTVITLFDSTFFDVDSNDDIGTTNTYSRLEFTPLVSGTYYLAVEGYSGTSTGDYYIGLSSSGTIDVTIQSGGDR